ncbi:MAG TPA: PLxRFG domain-containing protein, partial [Burkholderiaceae bacterium]|nr:PLxRFG domain-containing protein [Burkholderiaceae bacterium]
DINFSIAVDTLQSNDTARRLADRAMDVIRSDSTIGVLGRTVGTPYHLAHAKNADGSLRNPDLRKVYDEAQDYLNDINTFANDPAELAPGVVPMLNKWSDARNPLRLAGEKRARLARALFEGTLGWTRDDQGNPVESDDARGAGIEWTATELKQRYGFDDQDVGRYQQARAAIGRSLDFMAAAEVARQMGGRDLPEGLRAMVSRGDTGRFRGLVTNFLTQQVDGAKFALRMLKTEHREQLAAITGPEADARRAALKAKQAIALEVAQERLDKWQGLQRGVAKVYDRVTDLKDRGYMPLMRFGPHTVTVRDLDTKEVVFFGMYETQAEANVEARRLRESAAPNETVTRGEMSQEQWKLFKGVSPETVELFGQVAGVERTPVFEEYIRRTKANHSALKRLIQRKGTPGFSEDVQRVLAAFLTSNARAAAANLHAGAMEEATLAIDQERGLVKDYATRLTQYVQNPTDEAQGIRGLMFIQFIGGSVASALVNMTQPFTMTLPYLSQHGGPGAASRLLTAGMRKALTKIDPQSPLGVAMQRAEKDGIVSPQALHELQGQAVNRFGRIESGLRSLGVSTRAAEAIDSNLRRVLFAWGGFFSLAEQFNRRATFIAAYELAIERGMPDPFGFAEEAVKETQGVYNRCVDLETEMLTAAGWKRMADLVEGEAVYGLDADGRLVHDVLQAVHTYPGSQQVTELRNSNGLSIVATGHHDHLVQNYSSRDGKWQRLRKVRTKDLKNAHHLLRVPLGDATGRTPIYTDDEVALFAWVATEGHLFAHRGVTEKRGVGLVQSQRHNPHYVAEIDALLDRLGGHYNRKTARNGEMVCWQLRKPLWLKIHAALPGKVVTPALVASLTIPQMRLFIDTFTKGDGHFPEEGGNTITQRLRENLDALQAMAVLSGITSTVYYQVGAHDFGSIYLAKNSVRSHVKAMVESAERTVDTVWCPQTGSGCWIARRNGRTFVTGNSNRPQWARGPVGATVMTFKQFSISYLEFLSRLPRREKAIALGVLTLAAGLEGLPFADDLDDLIDTIMQRLFGKAFSAKRAKVEALTAMGMSRDSAEWVLRGASALPGFPVDLAGRMSLGNMIPGTGVLRTDGAKDKSAEVLEALGPAGGVVRDALRGEFSPVAVRNAVKGAEMFRTGQYRDELGRKVADVDGADAAAKALGFQPREIARESRGSRMAQSVVAQTRAAESDIVRLWAQGIADNEPDKVAEARAQLEAWNQRNPEARIAINRMQIARQVRDMRATREERLIRATPKELRGRVAQELQQ